MKSKTPKVSASVLDVLLAVHIASAGKPHHRRQYVSVDSLGLSDDPESAGAILLAVSSGYLSGARPLRSVCLTGAGRTTLRKHGMIDE